MGNHSSGGEKAIAIEEYFSYCVGFVSEMFDGGFQAEVIEAQGAWDHLILIVLKVGF